MPSKQFTKKGASRSRFGCHRCKRLKVKCDEQRPTCGYCTKSKQKCDYSMVLQWGGRPFKNSSKLNKGLSTIVSYNDKVQSMNHSVATTGEFGQFTIVQEKFPPPKPTRKVKRVKESKQVEELNLPINRTGAIESNVVALIPTRKTFNIEDLLNKPVPLTLSPVNENKKKQEPQVLEEQLRNIPLSIIPFPDLLLESPVLREYYHSYVHIFSKLLSPANPSIYTENPFTCLLPRISISAGTDGVLCALIATSVLHTSVCQNKPYPEAEINKLLSHSLKDLYNRLMDQKEAQSDYTLALILFLSFFENFRGKLHGWRAHYYGAKKIILSRGFLKEVPENGELQPRKYSFEMGQETDLIFFFSRWFAYLDVIGALCSSSSIYASSEKRNFLVWEGPIITDNDRENLKDIDLLMGFDFKLLEYFCEIIALVDKREKTCLSPDALSVEIIEKALDVKQLITSYMREKEFERDEIEVEILSNPMDPRREFLEDYRLLRATNSIFGFAGVLQIYRRVLMMSSKANVVQDIVKEMTCIFNEKIPENTTAAYCTVFSMFSAGCEAIDQETRQFYSNRLSTLHKNGSLPAVKAHELMVESWESGKYWADNLSAKNSDIVFV